MSSPSDTYTQTLTNDSSLVNSEVGGGVEPCILGTFLDHKSDHLRPSTTQNGTVIFGNVPACASLFCNLLERMRMEIALLARRAQRWN